MNQAAIMMLRSVHTTNYRDGVSDYIKLLVYSLWQIRLGSIYNVECGYIWVPFSPKIYTYIHLFSSYTKFEKLKMQYCRANKSTKYAWLEI